MKRFLGKQFGFKLQVVFLVLISGFSVFGAASDVDAGFDPQLTVEITGNYLGNVVLQPDGKIIVYGSYPLPGGARTYFNRLNIDGSIDPTFRCRVCSMFKPGGVAVQPDGKILVGVAGRNIPGSWIIRLNQDGSLDSSFNAPLNPFSNYCSPNYIIVQPDGKSLIKCNSVFTNLSAEESVRRLNSDGSVDPTFNSIVLPTGSPNQYIARMALLPNGQILLGGGYYQDYHGWLNRYNTNGSLDNGFQVTLNGKITGIGLPSDGKYLITGHFDNVSGNGRGFIAKLSADGNVDPSFTATLASAGYPQDLKILPNGQFYTILLTYPNGTLDPRYRFARFNADGSVDNTFSQTFMPAYDLTVDDSNRILTFRGRLYRLNTDGNIDAGFNPQLFVDGLATAAALQADGKVVIAGQFGKTNGIDRVRLARVNADGTTDPTFNPGTGFDVPPTILTIQPDGKILAGGLFTVYNGTPRTKLVRINADGSLDPTFSPNITGSNQNSIINVITPLANGKTLIGGDFTTVDGIARTQLARLNPDGSLDPAFNPVFAPATIIYTILVQTDGKIMVGGRFSGVNGLDLDSLVRFNADGTLDTGFIGVDGDVGQVIQQTDGKYIVSYKNISVYFNTVARLYNNGAVDYSFIRPSLDISPEVNAIFQQPSGNIVFGGRFNFANGRNKYNTARIDPNGGADIYFPTIGANDTVNTLTGQPDGKIIFVGNFTGIEDVPRPGIARLTLNNRTHGTLFDYDGDGKSDISVFRPSNNAWFKLLSADSSVSVQSFGLSGDVPAPAVFDGDGKTDLGVFRSSVGDWHYLSSLNNTVVPQHWGQAGDIPRPSDVTGDGKADLVLYRPSVGIWYRASAISLPFGIAGDQPLVGDFDGDSRNDMAVFRPSTGDWWYAASSANFEHRAVHWGASGDIPVPGDYDGDGKTDFVVYRPTDGGWYILYSTGAYTIATFGLAEDKPVAADYDGDGKTDIAVFRPSTGVWYLLQTTAGFGAVQWGLATDIPTENAFLP